VILPSVRVESGVAATCGHWPETFARTGGDEEVDCIQHGARIGGAWNERITGNQTAYSPRRTAYQMLLCCDLLYAAEHDDYTEDSSTLMTRV
jgi:hypothetical protein